MAASLKMCFCKTAWHSCVVQLIVGCVASSCTWGGTCAWGDLWTLSTN